MVSESTIDTVAEQLAADAERFTDRLAEFQAEQPVLAAYIFSENTEAFTDAERELFLFLSLLIYFSVAAHRGDTPPPVEEQDLAQAEEANYERMAAERGKPFHRRLDAFFAECAEEDLLATVEDALLDEEGDVTVEGREPLFLSLKSIIDSLTQ
jgi:hypothetical protein